MQARPCENFEKKHVMRANESKGKNKTNVDGLTVVLWHTNPHEAIINLQRSATLLASRETMVGPFTPSEEWTIYSFRGGSLHGVDDNKHLTRATHKH